MGRGKSKTDNIQELVQQGVAAVEKKYKGTPIGTGTEQLLYPSIWASLGSLALDRVCRGKNPGGIPIGPRYGRIVHIAGDWSTGKSLLLDHIFKSVQDLKGLAVCSETESSRDPHFAHAIGMDLDKITLLRPPTIEEAFDSFFLFHEQVRKQDEEIPIIWGIDSLESTEALRTAEKGLTESGVFHYGAGRSQALGASLRKMGVVCSRYPTTLVMLNQTRDKPGVLFGKKKQTPGGNPPHFYASLEIWLSGSPKGDVRGDYKGAKLTGEQRKRLGMRATERGDVVGRWIRAKIEKTKVSSTPGQEADFYISFTRGVHKWGGLLQRLLHEGMIQMGQKEQIVHNGETFENENEWLGWMESHQEILTIGEKEKDEQSFPDHAAEDAEGAGVDAPPE